MAVSLLSLVSCQNYNGEIASNATTTTPNNISLEKPDKEFDWKQGVKVNEVLDYLDVPDEERLKHEGETIKAVFDQGNTIWFKTDKSGYRASMATKQVEVNNVIPSQIFDKRFWMIHSLKFVDAFENKEILV